MNGWAGFSLDVHVHIHTYIRSSMMRVGKVRGHEVSTTRTTLLLVMLVVSSIMNLHGLVVPNVTVHPLVQGLDLCVCLGLAIVVPMLLMRVVMLVLVIHGHRGGRTVHLLALHHWLGRMTRHGRWQWRGWAVVVEGRSSRWSSTAWDVHGCGLVTVSRMRWTHDGDVVLG